MPEQEIPEDIYTIRLVLRRRFLDSNGTVRDLHDTLCELETPLCFTSIEMATTTLNHIAKWVKDYAKFFDQIYDKYEQKE